MKKLCWDLTKASFRIQLPQRRGVLCAAWAQAGRSPSDPPCFLSAARREAGISSEDRKKPPEERHATGTESNYDLEYVLGFRIPMAVSEILQLKNGDVYPVCPRCHITFEREYTHYCDRCGQALNWKKYRKATVIHSL